MFGLISLRPLFASSIVVALAACSEKPFSFPDAQSLAGSYFLSEKSVEFLRREKGYVILPSCQVRIGGDGAASVIQMPDAYVNFGRGSMGFVSGEGRWKVESADGDYGLEITIDKGGSMAAGIYAANSILIRGHKPPYQLEVQLGDPDSAESLTFETRDGHEK